MIYFIQRKRDGLIKIGYTGNVGERFSGLKSEHGAIELLGIMEGDRDTENQLHKQFADYRFEKREWFSDSTSIREYIASNTKQGTDRDKKHHALRLEPVTKIAIDLLTVRQMQKVGRKLSNNDALWMFIEECRPDIAERVKQILQST